MATVRSVNPEELRAVITRVAGWLDDRAPEPPRADVAKAVRLSLRALAVSAPGHSVEVRVPPFGAVQCVEGVRHKRGTPPNVVEMDPKTWLLLATGRLQWTDAVAGGRISASGSRAELVAWLPVL